MVSNAIMKLFRILSTWRLAKNLALEINVYSPSDYEHWFKHIYVCSDDVEHNGDANRGAILYHDVRHGWVHGRQVKSPPRSAILRLFRPLE